MLGELGADILAGLVIAMAVWYLLGDWHGSER